MNWISVKDELPEDYEDVLVWVKYEGLKEYEFSYSWIQANSSYYKEPNTRKCWALGSAKNYVITHWMRIEDPIK